MPMTILPDQQGQKIQTLKYRISQLELQLNQQMLHNKTLAREVYLLKGISLGLGLLIVLLVAILGRYIT